MILKIHPNFQRDIEVDSSQGIFSLEIYVEENSLSKSSMNMAGNPKVHRISFVRRWVVFFFFQVRFRGVRRSDFIKARFGVKHFLDMGEFGPRMDFWSLDWSLNWLLKNWGRGEMNWTS